MNKEVRQFVRVHVPYSNFSDEWVERMNEKAEFARIEADAERRAYMYEMELEANYCAPYHVMENK